MITEDRKQKGTPYEKLDILAKEYMKRPSIFADVFNQYLYQGRQVIAAEALTEPDTTELAVP